MNIELKDNIRVLITGGTPDLINRNRMIRHHISEGFSNILGIGQVKDLPLEVAASRVINWRPSIVLVAGSCLPDYCDYTGLRHACDQTGAILAFWLHDDPYEFDSSAKIMSIADHIFSNDRWASEHYHRDNVWHLPLAASPLAHQPDNIISEDLMQRDVFFCGVGFQNRRMILKDLSASLKKVHTEIYGDDWNTEELAFCRNQRIASEELRDYYATSRIVLNLGRDFHYANNKYLLAPSTPGPRTFEAAMAGACQMMFVDSLEIMDYFKIDDEVVLFNDPTEFEVRLDDLLHDPDKRARIGSAARARCLKDHTYSARAGKILEQVGMMSKAVSTLL